MMWIEGSNDQLDVLVLRLVVLKLVVPSRLVVLEVRVLSRLVAPRLVRLRLSVALRLSSSSGAILV
jgi:hypothetical protein